MPLLRSTSVVLRIASLLLFVAVGAIEALGEVKTAAVPDFEKTVKPLFAKYCYTCHNDRKKKGDLSLESFQTESDALREKPIWEKVLHNVETREMPPETKPQPSSNERELIIRWIEARVLKCDCDHPDPGRVTIRRLNSNEYNNTIRDLIGLDLHPADDFPADDTGYGFDNIGDVLSLPPVLFEKYAITAGKVLDAAIVVHPDTNGPVQHVKGQKCETRGPNETLPSGGIKLVREGVVSHRFKFSKPGEYLVRIKAWGDLGGDGPPKMRVSIDNTVVQTFDVNVRSDDAKLYLYKFNSTAGTHLIESAFINNFYNPKEPDPDKRDRNLAIEFIEVVGPTGPQPLPESHKRILTHPFSASMNERKYARDIISAFASRAYRRPATSVDVNRLMALYDLARKDGENVVGSVKLALQAVLVSPHFLFRGEVQQQPNNPTNISEVDEFALASRLSYFLWSTMPDDELLQLASTKKLRKNLDGQLRRLLRDPKAEAFVTNFAGQWLQLRNLKLVQPDPETFPNFDENLRSSMERETQLLFANILRQDRPVLDFLDANYTFIDERLANHYGITNFATSRAVKEMGFQRIELKNGERGGLLNHASILTLTSNPTRTSPVKRGKFVLENILGTPPPPPPPNVPELKEDKGQQLTGTLRQRMEQHRADPNCASCHARMDPIGFGLENFDGIGAWRLQEGNAKIDPSGTLVSGENFNGPKELKRILVKTKKDEFVRCLAEKILTYALGRGLEFYDKCAVDQICKEMQRNDYRISALIRGVVNSTPFQMCRGETAKP